ncbi:AraC family transcriptional regulator [Dyella kyungheensis]|uniref:AraC family transcriptional regulator n=1 Tax=Dyella kyungheensis TaxID=1242174 RepID=A0ABS2JSC9_9GAMM|nr:AraC family transcriptional regulator [Dyella kyungheensis]MBM7121935.1 AraC family transcriptional regulator [Dyella kyungheensis]
MNNSREKSSDDWIRLSRDPDTGIETVHAHFRGHAYDPHDHDEVLVGVTQQGVQQFRCHRTTHRSTEGRVMLIEPGAVHDGYAPQEFGFTYAMLYLPQRWLASMAGRLDSVDASGMGSAFRKTVATDDKLRDTIQNAFLALHFKEAKLARDQCLDELVRRLSMHTSPTVTPASNSPDQVLLARDFLHDQMARDIGLDELTAHSGIDRFRLTRQFKRMFGLSPHAYLVRLRLRVARALLAGGGTPSQVALDVGFADQSHMGRWFQRAYRLSPAAYQSQCTNVLDRPLTP